MKAQEITNTIGKLCETIQKERHLYGNYDLRVRIGRELLAWIAVYDSGAIINYDDHTKGKTIFGCPIEINLENTMCLEVHVVRFVPIYREFEAQKSSHQVAAAKDDQTTIL